MCVECARLVRDEGKWKWAETINLHRTTLECLLAARRPEGTLSVRHEELEKLCRENRELRSQVDALTACQVVHPEMVTRLEQLRQALTEAREEIRLLREGIKP